jgi:tagatose 6-phosphate kinase
MSMILAVCLNPATDVTYEIARLVPGSSHPVRSVLTRAGGKAVNTARVLAQLGEDVTLCGFAGGDRGKRLRSALPDSGVRDAFTEIAGETRQSVAVFDHDQVTVFNEPGPRIGAAEWAELSAAFEKRLHDAAAVVMSGSVPPGAPPDAYARLVRIAHQHGVPTVVDASGTQLANVLPAGPTVTAPNREELADALNLPVARHDELVAATTELSRRTGCTAVVSAGTDGIVAVTGDSRWIARPPRVLSGNPTGAGDALTAGLVRGLASRADLPAVLTDALALAASAVASPVAGEIDVDVYMELRDLAAIEEI